MSTREVLIAVSIDVECDKGPNWEVQSPLRFTSVTEGIPNLLTPLFQRYSIKPTYLISPEVLQNKECVRVLNSLENCELGTHLHGEFIPPYDNASTTRTQTPQFLYPPEIEQKKLENLTDLFERCFGFRPTSFRAGRFGISRYTLRFIYELGYLVDSSVTPFWIHNFEGRGRRNFWGAPLQPYFPQWNDPGRPGRACILEVPVTIVNPLMAKWPAWILRCMGNRISWYKRILRLMGIQVPKTLWLRPQRTSAQEMIAIVNHLITLVPPNNPIVLNMMYHSVEVIPGASPYAQSDKDVQAILHVQDVLFQYLQEHFKLKPVGLSEIYTFYRNKR